MLIAVITWVFSGSAQTYTTRTAGDWSSAATWVGGIVPDGNITSGETVNVNHDLTYNGSGDLVIAGKLNITGATLLFSASFTDKIQVNASGFLNLRDGNFMTDMPSKNNLMNVNGGRISAENSRLYISKDILSSSGSRKRFKNCVIMVGGKYELKGNVNSKAIDTLDHSLLEIIDGDLDNKIYSIMRVANVQIKINNGSMRNDVNSDFSILPGANENFGIDLLKIEKDMENKGTWNALIDAFCIGGNIQGTTMADIDFFRPEDCSLKPASAPAPELTFSNPVLVSGTANKQGAIYRFANVYPGVDAQVQLVRFSRSDIVMSNFDKADMGWGKALQPEFGLPGLVKPYQNWFIDFELSFYDNGTNNIRVMDKVDITALDVDGDNNSVMEYAVFQNPSRVTYSTVSVLNNSLNIVTGGTFQCGTCNTAKLLIPCTTCGGDGKTGYWNWYDCTDCNATGNVYSGCNHPFEGTTGNSIQGPVDNFMNIDTSATQVMATYQYFGKEKIRFRYGAKSGSRSSNGSGIRLNSLWFRQFNLAPQSSNISILPVKITEFTATAQNRVVNLKWTGHEENFSHYILQRSEDGRNYKDIAVVFANGNNGNASNYMYKDANVLSNTGMLYYRLELVDKVQEQVKYSDIRMINLAKNSQDLKMIAYPNPVKNQLRMTLPESWQNKPVVIELYSASGTRVSAIQLGSASQTETIDMSRYNKGVYLVKASCNGEESQETVIKN